MSKPCQRPITSAFIHPRPNLQVQLLGRKFLCFCWCWRDLFGNWVDCIDGNAVITSVCVMWILYMEQITSLLCVVCTTKEDIDFLQSDRLGLRNEKPNEETQDDIGGHKEEE